MKSMNADIADKTRINAEKIISRLVRALQRLLRIGHKIFRSIQRHPVKNEPRL